MENIFHSDEVGRHNFIQLMMQSFECTYICLWQYVPPTSDLIDNSCLLCLDGFYNEESSQASSSSGSLAGQLFNDYKQQLIPTQDGHIPGFALQRNLTYIEMNELDLQTSASSEVQRQFYLEARIKNAIFMGCKSGEIELGFSKMPQIDLKGEIRKLFAVNFSMQYSPLIEIPQPAEQIRTSSSSSSVRSLSMGSPESSSFLFNIPNTSPLTETLTSPLHPVQPTSATSHDQQAMQPLFDIQNIQFLSPETEHAAMTSAYLAVLSSPSIPAPTTITTTAPQETGRSRSNQRRSAFRSYTSALAPTHQMRANLRRENMMNRAIQYYRSVHSAKFGAYQQGSRPSNTQLHHMIAERKRREKLNESFQALRSLLPQETKKDKASVLASTKDYLNQLKALVAELSGKIQQLEAQLPGREGGFHEEAASSLSKNNSHVSIRQGSASTSEGQIVELHVAVRDESCPMVDISIRILEFLRQDRNVSLMSMEGNTHEAEGGPSNHLILRLRVEGDEWDESTFLEAVRRVVDDLVR